MDFVDLDKVLDQFEEEEKKAEEILPGQELRPSGYAEFLDRHQDRPWESLSLGQQPVDTGSKQLHLHSQALAYDDPYDSLDRSSAGGSLKSLSFPANRNSYIQQQQEEADPDSLGQSLEQELAQAKLKEETIEAYLPALHLSNGLGRGSGVDLNGWVEGGGKGDNEGERRGLIASFPASIQTDVLSPASEKELLSYPLPKSDILVEGHGQPSEGDSIPQLPSSSSADCQTNTNNYASSNGISCTPPSVATQGSEGVNPPLSADVSSSSQPSQTPGIERNAAPESESRKGNANRDREVHHMETSPASAVDLQPPDEKMKSAEQKEAEVSMQREVADPAREEAEDRAAEKAVVGFGNEDSDMDKDEVDAYLEELESSMLEKTGAETAVLEGSTGLHSAASNVQPSTRNDDETSATVQASLDSGAIQQSQATVQASANGSGDETLDHTSMDSLAATVSVGDDDGETKGQKSKGNSLSGADRAEGQNCEGVEHSASSSDCKAMMPGVPHQSMSGQDSVVVSSSRDTPVVRTDSSDVQSHHRVDEDDNNSRQTSVRTDMEQNTDAPHMKTSGTGEKADSTSLEVSDSAKPTEGYPDTTNTNNRTMDTTSLEFPVAASKNGVSSITKGKLEIEGLLDEIVAARLAQKPTEVVKEGRDDNSGQGTVEKMAPRDSEGGERPRVEGWGPEGSMVATMVRDSSAEVTSNALAGSPSPTLGIGARPKDPSQMKKSRPNSLLGLSKISLGSPFSPQQTAAAGVVEVMLPNNPHHQPPAPPEGGGRMMARQLGVSPPPPEQTAMDGTPQSCLLEEELEAPIMRRGEAGGGEDGEEASNGGGSGAHRPQSWSPCSGGMSSPPNQRSKRPTSLNLPIRQDRVGSVSPDTDHPPRPRKAAGLMAESAGSSEAGSSEEESMGVGGTDGSSSAYGEMRGDPHQPEQEGAGAAAEVAPENPPPSILHMNLGKIAPTWLPDADAPCCMECAARFTFTKRRHHCRACGKIFCSTCCGQKSRLTYLENKEGRVCVACFHILSSAQCVRPAGVACRSPNPNNPIEYCSTVPPTQQANARAPLPTVMVPTGVLKRHGSKKSEPKQVMFSDGIRPGGDLTELDGSDQARIPPRRSGRPQKKVDKQQGEHSSAKTRRLRGSDGLRNPCLIPDDGLPPVVVHTDDKGEVNLSDSVDPASLMTQIRNEEASPVVFAINMNLFVQVKIINLDCCVKRVVWVFTTQGMVTVGQEELVLVLETLPEEDSVPRDIFCHLSTVYQEAGNGNTVSHMGHSIFSQSFLDSGSHGGFLYLRASFQCTNKLPLPPAPFLFPILLHKWETPWAKVFPIRLMLRLGAEHRYYPCPLVSIRNRKPVFFEIGHTIMNLLADFRNFQYTLQQIPGVSIHMEDQHTFINFPRNRYHEVMKVVSSSNEHVMALGASFSLEADSHLVCIQNEDGNYQTQAINIQNKPRQVTGASFVVFNGALKSSAGLRAKSSIVEDGLMVQILPETMGALKQSLKDMKDFVIPCGSVSLPEPEEVVTLRWVDDDKNINVGVKSPVDGMSLEGVESVPVHNATDYVGEQLAIRWTQLFFLQTESGLSRWEPVDMSRVAETLANAVCIALTPHLPKLKEAALTKIGLRVTLQPDNVGYEVGSGGERLPDFYINDLDNALIPVIHGAVTNNQESPIVIELHLYLIH